MKKLITLTICIGFLCACQSKTEFTHKTQNNRSFETSFESVSDFEGFYIFPKETFDSDHDLTNENVFDGILSHKAWITDSRADDNDGTYRPHRAYPTIQLHKTEQGSFATPALVSLWVNLDMALEEKPTGSIDDWFSFITISPDSSDKWARTVLVNITPDGYLRLVHVPDQGQQTHIYQAGAQNDQNNALLFPYRQWVKIDMYLDFSEQDGYAKVWQNGQLVSHAQLTTDSNTIEQAHFGLYASASIAQGSIYNDALTIQEIKDEASALELIHSNQ